MRHRKKPKLAKGYDLDRRIMRAMSAALILHEKIETTSKRAKLVRSAVERFITSGKSAELHRKRLLFSALPANAARKVFEVLGPKYIDRKGGYTRLTRVGKTKDGDTKVAI